jgi:hypothetical protein
MAIAKFEICFHWSSVRRGLKPPAQNEWMLHNEGIGVSGVSPRVVYNELPRVRGCQSNHEPFRFQPGVSTPGFQEKTKPSVNAMGFSVQFSLLEKVLQNFDSI